LRDLKTPLAFLTLSATQDGAVIFFDVSELDSQQKYRLLNGGVTPRPIGWIKLKQANVWST
tara:strand:+ start:485 stop:667 length:183 start_codon:yes stop_codon:yes gene_type:complete